MKKFAFLYVFGWRPDGVWRFGEPELVAYPANSPRAAPGVFEILAAPRKGANPAFPDLCTSYGSNAGFLPFT